MRTGSRCLRFQLPLAKRCERRERAILYQWQLKQTYFTSTLFLLQLCGPLKPAGGLENAKRPFSVNPCKIALYLKTVCYKVSLCEHHQQQTCKAFTGLLCAHGSRCTSAIIHMKIWLKLTNPLQNRRFPISIRS